MTRDAARKLKVPPYSIRSEKVVLGSILRKLDLMKRIRKLIKCSDDFFRPEHGKRFIF